LIVEHEAVNEKIWNEALGEAGPNGTLFQSTYWAGYLKKTFGDRPLYVESLDKKGNIEGLLLAVESCYAKHPSLTLLGARGRVFGRLYKRVLSPAFHRMLPFIFWEGGPIILPRFSEQETVQRETLYRKIIERVVEEAARRNCYEIKIARPPFFDDQSVMYSSLGFQKKRMGTMLIRLDQPIDVIWGRIERKTRQIIRRTMEKSVEFNKVDKLEELEEFYGVCVQKSERTETKIYPFSYYANLWKFFYPRNMIVSFTLSLKDTPLGVLTFLMHNKIIHIHSGGDSDYARLNKMEATRALIWHMVEWAHEIGFKYFDLAGVELYKMDAGYKKAIDICAFKSKWGGQLVEYHDYERKLQERKLARRAHAFLNHFTADSIATTV
jgi:hypothetical protein